MGSQPQTFEQPAIATAIDPNATVASLGTADWKAFRRQAL